MLKDWKRRRKWRQMMDAIDVLVVDTETTGLGDNAEIVEIAILDTTGAILYDDLIMPAGPIPRGASNVHGLTRAVLKKSGARPWPEHHEKVCALVRNARAILAYNAEYDSRLLAQTAARYDLALPPAHWHCAMLAYAERRNVIGRYGDPKWHRLGDAMAHENLAIEGRQHRALADAKAALAIMRVLAQ